VEVSSQLHAPAALTPGKRYGTHYILGWVGPRAYLFVVILSANLSHVLPRDLFQLVFITKIRYDFLQHVLTQHPI
jgi:hypothetical protein